MHLIHFVWETHIDEAGLLHAFCNLSIQLVSQLTLLLLLLHPEPNFELPEPFKGILKVFPSHQQQAGTSSPRLRTVDCGL